MKIQWSGKSHNQMQKLRATFPAQDVGKKVIASNFYIKAGHRENLWSGVRSEKALTGWDIKQGALKCSSTSRSWVVWYMLGKLEGLITLESLKEQGLIPQMIRINIIRMMRIISNNIISDEIDIISDDDIIINDENNSYQIKVRNCSSCC